MCKKKLEVYLRSRLTLHHLVKEVVVDPAYARARLYSAWIESGLELDQTGSPNSIVYITGPLLRYSAINRLQSILYQKETLHQKRSMLSFSHPPSLFLRIKNVGEAPDSLESEQNKKTIIESNFERDDHFQGETLFDEIRFLILKTTVLETKRWRSKMYQARSMFCTAVIAVRRWCVHQSMKSAFKPKGRRMLAQQDHQLAVGPTLYRNQYNFSPLRSGFVSSNRFNPVFLFGSSEKLIFSSFFPGLHRRCSITQVL